MHKTRTENFSDAVFAIVITLLVLEIKIPEGVDYEHLPFAIVHHVMPSIAAYLMSFIIIGHYWMYHHQAFEHVIRLNGALLWLNILFLMTVCFIPFPTTLLGHYPGKALPIIMYGGTLIACNMIGIVMLNYARKKTGIIDSNFSLNYMRYNLPVFIGGNTLYALAMILAPYYPLISYCIYGGVVLVLTIRRVINIK